MKQLPEELNARGFYNTDRNKDDLEGVLKEMLTGVQHVPTLMLLNPTGALSDLNPDEYTVLDCEPLHDVKGHLILLCKELPHLLTRKSCEDIISTTVSDRMTCADHRIVVLQEQRFKREASNDGIGTVNDGMNKEESKTILVNHAMERVERYMHVKMTVTVK